MAFIDYFIRRAPTERWQRRIMLMVMIVAILGIVLSLFLTHQNVTQSAFESCPIYGGGCDAVNKSPYSKMFGIPVAVYGVLFYSAVMLFSLVFLQEGNRYRSLIFVPVLTLVGVLMSAYFVYVQAELVGAFCFYCGMSAVFTVVMFIAALPLWHVKPTTAV